MARRSNFSPSAFGGRPRFFGLSMRTIVVPQKRLAISFRWHYYSGIDNAPEPDVTKITTQETKLNGKRRFHFVSPCGKSLRTWASKRSALEAGKREFQWVK